MRRNRLQLTGRPLESNINVTPLVDVCLVLLIIFMVVTPVIVQGVPIDLPDAKTAKQIEREKHQLAISIKAGGTFFVGGVIIRREQLATEIAAAAKSDPNRSVIVRADRAAIYGDAVYAMRLCRDAGFRDVGLATNPPQQP